MIPVLANCWFIEFSLRKVRYTVTSEDVYDFSDTRININEVDEGENIAFMISTNDLGGTLDDEYGLRDLGDDIDSIVVVGRQIGNSVIYDEEDHIDALTCYENVHNTEELLDSNDFFSSLGIGIFGFGASIALIVGGIIVVIKGFR